MSYRAWQHYGLDKSLPGSSLVINGVPMTLVGIAPPGFFGDRLESDPPDFWMPLALEPTLARENTLLNQRDAAWLFAIGRLRPGVNPAEVSAQMTVELQQWLSTPGNLNNHKEANKIKDQKIKIAPGATGVQEMADEAHQGLYLLMAASAVLAPDNRRGDGESRKATVVIFLLLIAFRAQSVPEVSMCHRREAIGFAPGHVRLPEVGT